MAKPLATTRKKEEIPPELVELRAEMESLPRATREKLVPLCERLAHFVHLQGRLIGIAQDAIDQLHMDNRYLLFDAEASRRERDALRAELEKWEGD